MGKGDKKTFRGKIFAGSHGKVRKKNKTKVATKKVVKKKQQLNVQIGIRWNGHRQVNSR